MRRPTYRAMALVTALGLAAGCAAAARRGEPIGRPIAITDAWEARGQVIYMKHCYHCHQAGEGGQGTVLNLPLPEAAIRAQVRLGVGAMPAFGRDRISDAELDELVAYLRAQRRS